MEHCVHTWNLSAVAVETVDPGACWPASLTYLVSSRPIKDQLLSKQMQQQQQQQQQHGSESKVLAIT